MKTLRIVYANLSAGGPGYEAAVKNAMAGKVDAVEISRRDDAETRTHDPDRPLFRVSLDGETLELSHPLVRTLAKVTKQAIRDWQKDIDENWVKF